MKNQKIINSKTKLVIFITALVSGVLAFMINNLFLSGELIEIPKRSTEGAVMIAVGCLGIVIISALAGVGVMLVLKRILGVGVL